MKKIIVLLLVFAILFAGAYIIIKKPFADESETSSNTSATGDNNSKAEGTVSKSSVELSEDANKVKNLNSFIIADEAKNGKCASIEAAFQILRSNDLLPETLKTPEDYASLDILKCADESNWLVWCQPAGRFMLVDAATKKAIYPNDFGENIYIDANDEYGYIYSYILNMATEAHQSAAIIEIKNINTSLIIEEYSNGKPTDLATFKTFAESNGFHPDFSFYRAINLLFVWSPSENKVMLINLLTNEIIYPNNYPAGFYNEHKDECFDLGDSLK